MLNSLLARFSSEPALVAGGQEAVFQSSLAAIAKHPKSEELLSERAYSDDDFWFSQDDWRSRYRPYVVVNGILQVPVRGILLHDFPFQFGSWATGYAYIWKAVERGMSDPQVRGIALVIHSPGGEVAGCFELVDRIYEVRGDKPIRAFAHEYAYSAAYAIASVADNITVSKTGGVGSIGVVTMHIDVSKALDANGLKVTFIKRGKHKTDGNPFEPLPADVEARIQERIDALGEVFESSVARNRSMDAGTIRGFEALTFMPSEAVSNGLADAIGPLDDAMDAYASDLSTNEGDEQMGNQAPGAVDQAAIDTARTEGHATGKTEGLTEGKTTGMTEGATAERERISAIINSDEGKKRPAAAMAAALDTDMSAEAASKFLAKLPEEPKEEATTTTTETPGQQFDKAMGDSGNPDVGADGGAQLSTVDSIFANAGIPQKTA